MTSRKTTMALRGTASSPPMDVLALLPLPDLDDLPERQFAGTACVWCGQPVATPTAIDLGQRRITGSDGHITASPRACRRCTGTQAYRVLLDHAACCELCVENAADCDTGRALNRLVREGRR